MGVDLFFVLSGFLITGILLDSRQVRSNAYYGGFYGRRMLRIAPAFVGLMAALVFAPSLTGQTAAAHNKLLMHEVLYWSFLANAIIAVYGWAGVISQTSPLWSLAIEEQFYLIWPWVVRRITARGILRLGIVMIVLAALERLVLALFGVSGDTLYVLMPTRADLLAWGAVLAALSRIPNGIAVIRRLLWPALAGATCILLAVIVRNHSLYFDYRAMVVIGYPAIAVAAACLVAIAIVYDPAVLRLSWLRGMGKVSYGFYLWHMTAIAVLVHLLPDPQLSLIPLAFLLSLAPTLLSWYLIERPALSLKRYTPSASTRL